jgi:hypothetical protein
MKTATKIKLWQRNGPIWCATGLPLAVASALIIGLMPLAAPGQINGTTAGTTAMAIVGDDNITVSTINIGYFTSCYFISNGLTTNGAWGNNYLFAGQGAASGVGNISSSDFTVGSYAPFIGTSTATSNFVALPSGDKIYADGLNGSRGSLNNAEAGGMGINISYKPQNGDPTNINFVQAYVESINGSAFSSGTIDGSTPTLPFYNAGSVAGTGTNLQLGMSPLMTSSTRPGWLADQPYDNEWGSPPTADDTITNTAVYFQTFVEAQQTINGTNYNVLYGGIQWGYTFSTLDVVPEPGGIALVAAGLLGIALRRRHLRPRA